MNDAPQTGENLRYLFDDCVLDTDRRELRRGSEVVEVAPQVFDLLAHLIRDRNRVVSKDELLASVWQDARLGSAFQSVQRGRARSATGDQQGLIKTLPLRGRAFRWRRAQEGFVSR
jgi:DNA-binding winged helix-turn-helix (wHTH) protein